MHRATARASRPIRSMSSATGARKRTVDGVIALEQATLELPEGIVLRYGYLYGPGTWYPNEKRAKPALHVDAAAQAALLAVSKGTRGIYNIAEDDGAISSEKAKRDLGFDAGFRSGLTPQNQFRSSPRTTSAHPRESGGPGQYIQNFAALDSRLRGNERSTLSSRRAPHRRAEARRPSDGYARQ